MNSSNPKNRKIIANIFQIKFGDIIQIFDDGIWSDVGFIKYPKVAAVGLHKSKFTILNKPARVVRV
jgi:hypothetical protein